VSRPTRATTTPVVSVQDAFCLHPTAGGAVVALRGLTMTVAAGERVLVHGPNGSGKTTLLRLLAGQQPLSAGRAEVAGRIVGGSARADRTTDRQRWRSARLGWVDQNPWRSLRPELDVMANVVLQQRLAGVAAGPARDAAAPLMERLGVAHLAGRRPGTLSGGEAQRVAVCAALAHGPALVLADEPSGELDAGAAAEVYQALAEAVAQARAALVLVSHDRKAARAADRVIRIRDGRLSETWTPHSTPESTPESKGESADSGELLVVDDRGWVRLPDAARAPTMVPLLHGDRSITLRPAGGGRPPAEGEAVSVPASLPAVQAVDGAPMARLRAVSKTYRGRTVLAGVDLDLAAGTLVAVRGRSGSGKSTLLRLLLGLERPDSGCVEVDGVELAGLDRAALARLRRRLAAYAGQDVHLAETSDGAANLDLARALRRLPADHTVVAGLLDRFDLGGLAGRQAGLLSGGERQRLAVARALAGQPRLLVCDEPTSQLDEASAERLTAVLVQAARDGIAVVVATHDPVLIAAAEQVLDLN
jgi:ABC-type lipoprotein export system ATPase subunit